MNNILDQPNLGTMPTSYAGFGKRLVAYIIDIIILQVVAYILGMIFGGNTTTVDTGGGFGAAFANANPIVSILSLVINWLYFAYQESSPTQATLGKKVMGIKVTNLNGERISFLNATGRFFGKFLSGIIILIGFIMAAFTEKKQALHDMLASTLVLNAR